MTVTDAGNALIQSAVQAEMNPVVAKATKSKAPKKSAGAATSETPTPSPKASYRFKDESGNITATLEANGKLWMRDEGGSLESWDSGRDWLKETLGTEIPPRNHDALLSALSEALGDYETVEPQAGPVGKVAPTVRPTLPTATTATKSAVPVPTDSKENTMKSAKTAAVATKKAAPAAKKSAAPVVKTASKPAAQTKSTASISKTGPNPECQCGCGQPVLNHKRQFLQGHDARFHSYIKKYERGQVKLGELPALVQTYIRKNGVKVHQG